MLERIYREVYSQTEYGKAAERRMSEKLSELRKKWGSESIVTEKFEIELEELWSAVMEIGLETGFVMGVRFMVEILLELNR